MNCDDRGFWDAVYFEDKTSESSEYLFQRYHINSDYLGFKNYTRSTDSDETIQRQYNEGKAEFEQFYSTIYPETTFAASDIIPLQRDSMTSSLTFEQIITGRRSLRNPTDYKMSLGEIGFVLQHSLGITNSGGNELGLPQRAAPSAGALYPLEAFLIPLSVENIELDLYHYRVSNHSLARLGRDIDRNEVSKFVFDHFMPVRSSLLVILVAFFYRQSIKYKERSYRFVLAEAGAILEHVALASEAIGLRSAMLGGYIDSISNSWVMVNGVDAGTVLCAAIGKEEK